MRRHVLYLSYDGLTDPLGESQILPYVLGIVKAGNHRFTIISYEKVGRFSEGEQRIRELIDNLPIHWFPATYHSKPPVLSTLFDLMDLKKRVKNLWKSDPFEIAHCRSYLTALIGLWTKRKLGVKFLFDMRGFWVDERVEGGIWNKRNPIFFLVYSWFKMKEKLLFREADHSISLTHKAKDIINEWQLRKELLPITVIPCCVDLDLFDPGEISEQDQDNLRSQLGIGPDDLVLSYVGSLGTWYMVKEMMGFFRELLKVQVNAKFLIFTKDDPASIQALANELRIDTEKILVTPVNRADMPSYLGLSDYSIFFIRPTFSKQASSPTKMGEILAMGVPIITNAGIGDSDLLISDLIGWTVDPYSRNVPELASHGWDSQHIRETACAHFSLKSGVRRYLECYEQLVGPDL